MPYANYADKLAHSKRVYRADPEYAAAKHRRHKAANPKLHAYWGQRHTCKQRCVPFKLSFAEWVGWWGDDFELRGRRHNQLQMCRYGDRGAYELGNIYKATQAENDAGPRYKTEDDIDEGLHPDIPF